MWHVQLFEQLRMLIEKIRMLLQKTYYIIAADHWSLPPVPVSGELRQIDFAAERDRCRTRHPKIAAFALPAQLQSTPRQ